MRKIPSNVPAPPIGAIGASSPYLAPVQERCMVGPGRMGTNMVRRLLRAGHQCVVYNLQREAVQAPLKEGAVGTMSLEDFAHKLKKPAVVDPTLKTLIPLSALRYEFGGHEEKAAAKKEGA